MLTNKPFSLGSLIPFFLSIVFIFTVSFGYSQSKLIDKLTVGAGVGVNHSIIGFKINYQIANNLDVFTSLGLNQILLGSPVLGLEYISKKNEIKKIKPFVNISAGKDLVVGYFIGEQNSNFVGETMRVKKVFFTGNVSAGILYNLSKVNNKIYAKFGLSTRYHNNQKVQNYIEDLNTTYDTDFSRKKRNIYFTPVLAFRFNLSDFM